MIVVKLIDWHPITSIPEDRKDGRDMLLWTSKTLVFEDQPNIGYWRAYDEENEDDFLGSKDEENGGYWDSIYEDLDRINGVTHWADFNPPE